jgi:4-oxalocrotonate tautomerase
MPHVIVKVWTGNNEEVKSLMAKKVARALVDSMGIPEESVSVAIEEIPKENWALEVYKPDILEKPESIYFRPGYIPDELK